MGVLNFWRMRYVNGPWDGQEHETTLRPTSFTVSVPSKDPEKRSGEMWRYEVGAEVEGVTLMVGKQER